ncbi:MAG: ABC transporter [Lentisphaerae bacterium GWF2_52_8]|nr:MAG: ABC transporter [Lentisphaerae bacterium GWF2_52_8]
MSYWYELLNQLPLDFLQFDFMKNALLSVILVTPLFALLGCMVINNQLTFFSDAIGHSALTGIAIGTLCGLTDPLWAMALFACVLTLVVCLLRQYSSASTDTIVGLVMAFAVALGVVILSRGGGFIKYSRYLIGDILTITPGEIFRLCVLLALVLLLWLTLYNQLFLASMNRSLARSRGINVWPVELVFSMAVALTVTLSIQWVGLLVINSMLILPAAAARNMARNAVQYTWFAVLFGLLSGLAGLVSSYYWDTAAGATIVLYAMACYLVSLILRRS